MRNKKYKHQKKYFAGFGLIELIVIAAIIAAAGIGGGFYFKESKNQQNLIELGKQKEKEAEALKEKILERQREQLQSIGEEPSANKATPTPKPTTSQVDTSNWKTYRNEKYGFEVRYPPEWEDPTEKDNSILFGISTPDDYQGTKLRISTVERNGKTLDQVIKEDNSANGVTFRDIEKASIGGVEAEKFIENRQGGFAASNLYTIHGRYIYKMWYGNRQGGDPIPPTASQVEIIFSTFKFIK